MPQWSSLATEVFLNDQKLLQLLEGVDGRLPIMLNGVLFGFLSLGIQTYIDSLGEKVASD